VRRRLGPRFGAEAGLIAAAAALAALLELDWPGIVATVFGAWLAIAVFEVVWSRTRPAEGAEPVAASPAPLPAPPPPAAARPAAPTPIAPQPPPDPAPQVPAPVARAAVPPPPPPPVEPPAPPRIEAPRAPAGPPRSWNLWELERAARALAGRDAAGDEERQYMLLYLRDFASADGKLPIDFDPLVREVFGEELVVAS
jgi:hypothetical protein